MRAGFCLVALAAACATASPVLDERKLPKEITARQHSHLEHHLLRARHRLASRALIPTDHSNESPTSDLEEPDDSVGQSNGGETPVDWHPNEPLRLPKLQLEPQVQAQAPPSPATTLLVTEYETTCVAGKTEAPSTTSSPHVVITRTTTHIHIQSPETSAADVAAAEQATPRTSTQQQQQTPSQLTYQPPPPQQQQPSFRTQTTPQPTEQQQPPPQTHEKPQPSHQQQSTHPQPQSPPQTQDKPQPSHQQQQQPTQQQTPKETQPKPQPTQHQPEPSSSAGPSINTNSLPTEFIPDLDPHSEIYKGLCQQQHDVHRKNHSMPPLLWNQTLFEYAKETAETCVYAHDLTPGGGGYGQNIAAGDAPGNITAVLSNAFYNAEIMLFLEAIGQWGNNNPNMANFEKWGHFTQMLWNSTVSKACYTSTCSPPGADPLDCDANGKSYLKNVGCGNGGTKAYFTVCNYYPPGNYPNEYSAVLPPQGALGIVEMTGQGLVGLS